MLLRQKKLAITALALIVIVLVAVTGYAAPRGGWQGERITITPSG